MIRKRIREFFCFKFNLLKFLYISFKLSLILLFLLNALGSGKLYSQNSDTSEYRTDEIKVVSKKLLINKFESPAKIQVLNKKMIESKNGNSLSDALQLGSGVFIKTYGGNGYLRSISMKGLGEEQTLVLLNGLR